MSPETGQKPTTDFLMYSHCSICRLLDLGPRSRSRYPGNLGNVVPGHGDLDIILDVGG